MSHCTNGKSGSGAAGAGQERLAKLIARAVEQMLHDQAGHDGQRNHRGCETFLSPAQLAQRWPLHPESIRRKLRRREIASVLIGRKRLIPLSEIERIEAEGRIPARDVRS
jgi:hypothetical protein